MGASNDGWQYPFPHTVLVSLSSNRKSSNSRQHNSENGNKARAQSKMAEAAGGDPLLLHLHKIPPSTTEETLDRVLHTLWETRKTGLGSAHEPEIRTLLALPTPQHLDPILACLRLIIRKFVNEKLTGDDVQKLLPLDLSVDLRRILVDVLQKHQNQWTEEASKDQPLWQRTRVSHQIKVNAPLAFTLFPTPELLSSLWPRQDDATSFPNGGSHGGSVAGFADPRLPYAALIPLHQDKDSSENMASIPRLKSMTWTMENRGITPANRVAVITLKLQDYTKSPSGKIEVKFQLSKDTLGAMLRSMAYISMQLLDTLQDYTKSPSGEIEVKFQLSKDTLDAMLRSMAYISEQLSNNVSHGEPSSKKQRQ